MSTNVKTTGAGSAQPEKDAIALLSGMTSYTGLTDASHRNFVEVMASLRVLEGVAVDRDHLLSLCETLSLLERFRENEPEVMAYLRAMQKQKDDHVEAQ